LVGKRVHFSPQGDGPAYYTILNYQPSRRQHRKSSSESDRRSDYVVVGRWSEEALEIDERALFWNAPLEGEAVLMENGQAEEEMEISWRREMGPPISVCSLPCPIGYRKQLIKEVDSFRGKLKTECAHIF
jgi:hypothetical protein